LLVLLDTDHFSILQREEQPAAGALRSRLRQLPTDQVTVSIISFQEQVQGWLAYINRARKAEQILKGFADLHDLLRNYTLRPVLPFNESSLKEFLSLQRQRIRVGTSDLRIAAIANANGAKLLSRNLRDFRQVPGLDVEDWTA
jgi:tRNA(fMet)-specific endonuclease VapC